MRSSHAARAKLRALSYLIPSRNEDCWQRRQPSARGCWAPCKAEAACYCLAARRGWPDPEGLGLAGPDLIAGGPQHPAHPTLAPGWRQRGNRAKSEWRQGKNLINVARLSGLEIALNPLIKGRFSGHLATLAPPWRGPFSRWRHRGATVARRGATVARPQWRPLWPGSASSGRPACSGAPLALLWRTSSAALEGLCNPARAH